MSHMVIYRGIDGKPGYQQAEDIHDAVTFVEQMRNQEGVEQARIFRLEEVVFEYKPYYHVELNATAFQHEPTVPPMPGPAQSLANGGLHEISEPLGVEQSPSYIHDESFEVVDTPTPTINLDESPAAPSEPVAPNGVRRGGLFGR